MIRYKPPHGRWARSLVAVAVAGGVGLAATPLLAATLAGTQIKNLATVTYEDAAGNVYSAQSNEAVVTVAQVYSASIGVDSNVTAAPGQIVYLPYVLTNTGNGLGAYQLSVSDDNTTPDSIDASTLTVYHDVNGNGVPEAGEPAVSSLTLPANVDNVANLVVAVEVPATAVAGETLGLTLQAQAEDGTGTVIPGGVTDLSPGGGLDGANDTVESTVTVTGDAVLVVTKSSTHDAVNHTISYTVTVRNNGQRSATDVVIFDGVPANTTLVSSGVSGLLAGNGDTIPVLNTTSPLTESGIGRDINADGDSSDDSEAQLGIDLNTDGDTADSNVAGVYAIDAELKPASSVSMTFTVSYDPAVIGGLGTIDNVAHVAGDTDATSGIDTLVSSNTSQVTVDADYAVTLQDTGINAGAAINDGGDDDAVVNDEQVVDSIATGGTAVFNAVVSNNGNAPDIYELAIGSSSFPAGTVFTLYDSSGTVPLTDTNGSGIDTGVIAPGTQSTIVVHATIPAGTTLAGPFDATITATSANDTDPSPAADSMLIVLQSLVPAVADIHTQTGGVIGSDEDALAAAPPYAPVDTLPASVGNAINIPLYIDNESGGSESYLLQAGSTWDGTALASLPAGWTVDFYVGAGGVPSGAPITATPVIAPGTVDFEIIAVVNVPNDAALASNDVAYDNDGDTTADTLDGNADGDGDYPVFIRIESALTGASDILLQAVDVDATRQISLVSAGSNQLEAGSSVGYGHTLSNSGNVDEYLELSASSSAAGWTSTVSLDTNGDGIADTEIGNLAMPGPISVLQANGSTTTVQLADSDGDSVLEIVLKPGDAIPLTVVVFAPANAAPGQVDVLTIDAVNADAVGPSAQIQDQTTVISGQVRIAKSAAVDTDCNGTADSGFLATQTSTVEPNQCVIWRLVAENQGSVDANNVIVTDAVPAYSLFEAGSLEYCLGNGCAPQPVSDSADADEGAIAAGSIVFYIGTSSDPVNGQGGVLVPGQIATTQFRVRVE